MFKSKGLSALCAVVSIVFIILLIVFYYREVISDFAILASFFCPIIVLIISVYSLIKK